MVTYEWLGNKRYKISYFEWFGHNFCDHGMCKVGTALNSFLKPILNRFSYMTHHIEA